VEQKIKDKQVKKPIDIFEALDQEGVEISYCTVRTIRQIEKKPKVAYIKESYLPGDICFAHILEKNHF
jgi:hypothetical protein